MNFLPSTIQPEAAVVKMNRSPGRKVMRQVTPRATGAIHIENRVEHVAQVDGTRPSAPFRGRYERRDQSPLRIRQVRGIRSPFHRPRYRHDEDFSHRFLGVWPLAYVFAGVFLAGIGLVNIWP